MFKQENVPAEEGFNPDQKINLNSKTNIHHTPRKVNTNRINLSQKIDLKNHQSSIKQQPKRKYQKKQKKSNIKLEHNEQKQQISNLIAPQPTLAEHLTGQTQPNSAQLDHPIMNQISYQDLSQFTPSVQTSSKVNSTPIYQKNFNSIATKHVKIEPPSFYQPIRVNPMEKIQLGPKVQRSILTQSTYSGNPKKYKIRVLNSDFTSMRYECFCSRQYLSYCATYHHLKKDHFDFLKENRRFSFTNVQEATDPVYGFRIKKIMRERLKCPKNESKQQIQKLPKQTKEKIKAQSPQIQQLITQLKGIEDQRDQQVHLLKLFERKLNKAGELVSQYQNMIKSFQQIFSILNIRQITQKLNNGPTVYQQSDPNDEDYFPQ